MTQRSQQRARTLRAIHVFELLVPHAAPAAKSRRTAGILRFEPLEARQMFSVAPLFYSVTGAGNNIANPTLGSANQPLAQPAGTNYGDGISSLTTTTAGGQALPSAREISDLLGAQSGDILDDRDLSAMSYAFGQFVDHDLDLTPTGDVSVPISVPAGDPQFDPTSTGTQTLPFTRSVTVAGTGTSTSNPLDQPTVVTSYLDLSQIYGSDATTAAALRTFSGGQLKEGAGGSLPQDVPSVAVANIDGSTQFNPALDMSGDVRANENDDLMAIEILFVHEHNRQAEILQQAHPTWTDQQLYEGARQITIAEYQSIVFNEYLPSLLGAGAISNYTGYNPSANPSIANVFSEAAFRFGHSQLDDDIQFETNSGSNYSFSYTAADGSIVAVNTGADIAEGDTGISLLDGFFNPNVMASSGAEAGLLKYLSSDVSQNVDLKMVDAVRNVLFGAPGSGAGGEDLFALDVERGRDVGLPTLNETRIAYGLTPYTSFAQISSDPTVQADLKQLYGSANNVELFVGGLAENHAAGSSVGSTFGAIIADQFQSIRDGDRLWYQNIFSGNDLKAIQNTTLADLIEDNTSLTNLQSDVFFFQTSISGRVLADSGQTGRGSSAQSLQGLAGITVSLEDTAGDVVATTTTTASGNYVFDNVDLGAYQVVVSDLPSKATAPAAQQVSVTRGGAISAINFDVLLNLPSGPSRTGGHNGSQSGGPGSGGFGQGGSELGGSGLGGFGGLGQGGLGQGGLGQGGLGQGGLAGGSPGRGR